MSSKPVRLYRRLRAMAMLARGRAQVRAGRTGRAAVAFDIAISQAVFDLDFERRGLEGALSAYEALGSNSVAAERALRLAEMLPGDLDIRRALVRNLKNAGNRSLAALHTADIARLVDNDADAWREAARALIDDTSDRDGAAAAWERLLELAPGDLEAHRALAAHYLTTVNPSLAIPHLRFQAETVPDPVEIESAAAALQAVGDLTGAEIAWSRLVMLDPGHLAARCQQARVLLDLGRGDAAVASLAETCALAPFNPDALRLLAQTLTQQKQFERAAEIWERLRAILPEDPEAVRFIADDLYDRGLRVQAAPLLAIAASQQPHNRQLWRRLAWARRGEENDAGEIDALLRITALAPNEVEDQKRLVELLAGAGRLREAEGLIAKMVAAEPDDLSMRVQLAKARTASGDAAGALETWRQVLAIHPTHPDASLAVGEALFGEGRLAEAADHLAIAAPAAARPAKVWTRVLRLRSVTDNLAGAAIALQRLIDNTPTFNAGYHRRLIVMLRSLGREYDTKASLIELLRHEPKNLSLLVPLAGALAARGDTAREIKTWRKVLKLAPDHPEATARLAQLEASPATPKASADMEQVQ